MGGFLDCRIAVDLNGADQHRADVLCVEKRGVSAATQQNQVLSRRCSGLIEAGGRRLVAIPRLLS